MRTGKNLSLLFVVILVVSGIAPVLASPFDSTAESASTAQQAAQNDSNVSVTVGAQLSTVMSATGAGLQSEFESEVFERELDGADDSRQAQVVAQRIESLDKRAQNIRAEYDRVTAQYEAGELTRSQYAQRLAMLNARAENVLRSLEQTEARLEQMSDLELSAVGADRATLGAAMATLGPITGPGASALHKRFVGEADGAVHVDTENGLTISVEQDDDRSRTVEHSRDDDSAISVRQNEALAAARNALSGPKDGWYLTKSGVNNERGFYQFEFAFDSKQTTGAATVLVDGSTGTVFSLDEEIERGEGNESDDNPERDELALVVSRGTPGPNQDVTIQALSNGQPAGDVAITVNGERAGTTNADGLLTVTLPAGDVTVKGVRGDAEGELELELDEPKNDQKASILRDLSANASIENGVATVKITYKDQPIPGALVYANGREVGRTNADGIVQFEAGATDDLEIEIAKGKFGAAFSFDVTNGTATLDGGARESDRTDLPSNSTDNKDRDTGDNSTAGDGTDADPNETTSDLPTDGDNVTQDPIEGNVTQDPIEAVPDGANVTDDVLDNATDNRTDELLEPLVN